MIFLVRVVFLIYNEIMKNIILFLTIFLGACASTSTVQMPRWYQYREIQTPKFTLAAWVKETSKQDPFHIYIEGDGRAYDSNGFLTKDPTPTSALMRKMAIADKSPNVAYLARPCQFVKDSVCSKEDWTTARFSPRAVASTAVAIQKIAKGHPVQIYAYSGGALLSGLVINNYPEIKVQRWTTFAGLLNHSSWTDYKKLKPLKGSLDLQELPRVPQVHYVGKKDKVVPLKLSVLWTQNKNLVILPKATHKGPFTGE